MKFIDEFRDKDLVQEIVRRYLAESAENIRTDLHGNVIAVANAAASLRLMRSCSERPKAPMP